MAEPLLSAGSTYDIVEVDGAPVLAGTAPEVVLGLDGRVAGSATVNRLMGDYEVRDGVLTFGALATTMMAGPPELMEQEQAVLRALQGDLAVEPGPGMGEVRLAGPSGGVLLRLRAAAGA